MYCASYTVQYSTQPSTILYWLQHLRMAVTYAILEKEAALSLYAALSSISLVS
jgi:hypothetical protein